MPWSGDEFNKIWDWVDEETDGKKISALKFNQQDNDFAAGIEKCLTKDGSNTPSANLPMGSSYKHTNVADATERDQYATLGQLMDFDHRYYEATHSTTNTYEIDPSPSIAAYGTGGLTFIVKMDHENTGTPYLNVNNLGDKEIRRRDTSLIAGEIENGDILLLVYDGLRFQIISEIKTFVDLPDVPASYAGDGEKMVTVKSDETGLEFTAVPDYQIKVVQYTSNDTWTCPVGVEFAYVECWGGGGGGGGVAGGQSGFYASKTIAVTPETGYAITIGTGGTGGSSPGDGQYSQFGSALVKAVGGQGGSISTDTSGCVGDIKIPGGGGLTYTRAGTIVGAESTGDEGEYYTEDSTYEYWLGGLAPAFGGSHTETGPGQFPGGGGGTLFAPSASLTYYNGASGLVRITYIISG